MMPQSAKAAVTKYHKLILYQPQKFISRSSGSWKSQIRVKAWTESVRAVFWVADS